MTDPIEGPVQTAGKGAGGSAVEGTGKKKDDWGYNLMTGLRLIVLFLVFIAAVQLYFTIQGVIGMWVSDQYIPLINAIYYIVVIIGGVWLLRGTFMRR